ncbi:hypothetical protein BKA70DRAFT_1295920 [Coprinopsis sp. MPI-PUGE-AT-0042]|nr:hypothetical protein BKA70DRAFT_1295920 [Coprinopsis sp. MPI-PUGE-AT-0042]
MVSTLPSELVREIVGYFSRKNDMGTLQAASLASSAFRVPCQEEIFSKVNIYKRHPTDRHLAGLEILRQNGTLLSYIKRVSVERSPDGLITFDEGPMQSSMVELIQLIATAPIQMFSFIGWEGQTTPEFQQAIIALIRSPNLSYLSLIYVPVELASLVESPYVRNLVLAFSWFSLGRPHEHQLFFGPFAPVPAAERRRKSLTSLTITPDVPTIRSLTDTLGFFDLDTVKELILGSCVGPRGDVPLLLALCAPSLCKLRTVASVIQSDMYPAIPYLLQLEELVVEEGNLEMNPYANLPFFLELLPSPNSLAYVEIEHFFEGDGMFPGSEELVANLDSILANRNKFTKLHTVKFKCALKDRLSLSPEERDAKWQGYWPGLKGAGVVVEMPSHS